MKGIKENNLYSNATIELSVVPRLDVLHRLQKGSSA
jgi:hypothetical protein